MEGRILNDAGDIGDYIRSVLFGGDASLESNTAKEADAKACAKGVVIELYDSAWQTSTFPSVNTFIGFQMTA